MTNSVDGRFVPPEITDRIRMLRESLPRDLRFIRGDQVEILQALNELLLAYAVELANGADFYRLDYTY